MSSDKDVLCVRIFRGTLKMSSDRNNETQESLKQEIKAIQAKCVNACTTIDNTPQRAPKDSADFTNRKISNYIEALRTEVQNSNTLLFTDDNLLTSQFLIEMKQKTEQLEEMKAFVKGNINDVNAEINRLQSLIDISKEAKLKPKTTMAEVTPEHLNKAKEKFKLMKKLLSGLIQSQFPDCHESIIEVLGILMSSENENGYVPITPENYKLMVLLKEMNIVTPNPYSDMEVKLTYY